VLHPTLVFFAGDERAARIEINGRDVPLQTGDCFMLPTGAAVRGESLDSTAVAVALDVTALRFAHDTPVTTYDAVRASIATFADEFPMDDALDVGRIAVPKGFRARWKERLERLRFELTTLAPRSGEAVQALLTLCAVDVARYASPVYQTPRSSRQVVLDVFRYINERLAEPIGLREIASAVNFSPAYLTDLVKRETGRPIVSWIIELRMRRAEQLLSKTDKPIADIAATVGYTDANSFGRAFTKRRGLSPWQWRRQYVQA
jgi:AraC-like DNA-binding protein